jgi:hypothetical protein
VGRSGSLALPTSELGCAEQLARFFPQAGPVRIPVQVSSSRGGSTCPREATLVEFSGAEYAIFLSKLPLEFGDRVKIEATREGRPTEATVVAVQYHEGLKAVAVRFLQGSCDWLVRQP